MAKGAPEIAVCQKHNRAYLAGPIDKRGFKEAFNVFHGIFDEKKSFN